MQPNSKMPHYMSEGGEKMQQANELRERMIQEFAENYMEKLFYFCLKKTGNQVEAEDLTQEIALEIIGSLNKGTIPTSFSGWVWQIVRNCYAKWAKEKHNRNETQSGSDIGDYEIEDTSENILDEMIHREEMSLLRRELAFIKSDYRNIVVAYYIENKSIRQIASALSLPENTVKSRLFRAREILKEGMDMAREFGKLSYNPEDIDFISNGLLGLDHEPWNFISRSLCKNILIAAYRTPSTAEELAMEVGVALPYMEEELRALVDATLMKKNGNQYETNFFIVSAEAQAKIHAHLQGLAPELTKAIVAALEYENEWKKKNCPEWHEGYQPFDDMKWALLMAETDTIEQYTLRPFNKNANEVDNVGPWGHTLRPNGGEWDLLGLEKQHAYAPNYVSLVGCVTSPAESKLSEIRYRQYLFKQFSETHTPTLNYSDGKGLVAVANGQWNEVDEATLKRLEKVGVLKKTSDGYIPTILVMRKEKFKKMPKEARDCFDELRYKARDIAAKHYLFCREQIYKEIPDFLKDDEFQIDHACANIFAMRGAVLEEAIKQGYLLFDKNRDNRALGAYLII